MSKVLKVHTVPKRVETMGTVENECEAFSDEWLQIDTFKDWLERVPEDQYKARCAVCKVTLDCSISQLSKHAGCSGHQIAFQNSRKRKAVIGQLIGKVMLRLNFDKLQRKCPSLEYLSNITKCMPYEVIMNDVYPLS
jgi:hypothetical protein